MIKFLKATFTLALFTCCHSAFAQDEYLVQVMKSQFRAKNIIPPSPDAAALGQYGNIPVSLFTGTPGINVPLVELKGNMLHLPVSLSYNANGFKPEEVASWVGLGWTLNAGGVITRSVYGSPDVNTNYFKSPSPLRDVTSLSDYDKVLYFRDISYGFEETQPDMYFYNFNGRSGKFYLTPSHGVFKKEKDMLSAGIF